MTSPSHKQKPDQSEPDITKDPGALLITGAFLGVFAAALVALVMKAMGVEWTSEYWGTPINPSLGSFTRLQIFQGFALLAGGLATFALAAWRTSAASRQAHAANEQVRATFAAQQIDRAKQIADLLEYDKSEVSQISGITAAAELAASDPERYYIRMASILAYIIRRSASRDAYELRRKQHDEQGTTDTNPEVLATALTELSQLRNSIANSRDLEVASGWRLDMTGARLCHLSMMNLNFRRSVFGNALLSGDFRFADCDYSYSIFRSNARVEEGKFVGCSFENVQIFGEAIFSSVGFWLCDFTYLNSTSSDWAGCQFAQCNMSAMNLPPNTALPRTSFVGCWHWANLPPTGVFATAAFDGVFSIYDPGPGSIHIERHRQAQIKGPPNRRHLLRKGKH